MEKSSNSNGLFDGNEMTAVGCAICFISALCLSVVGIQTRMMQEISFVLVILYYSLLAVILTAFAILVQDASESTKLLHYNKEQYLAALLPGILHAGAIYSLTIAMQNERPGFVALIGYMGIVYAFVGDAFIYSQTLYGHEMLGISILVALNATLVFRRLSQSA